MLTCDTHKKKLFSFSGDRRCARWCDMDCVMGNDQFSHRRTAFFIDFSWLIVRQKWKNGKVASFFFHIQAGSFLDFMDDEKKSIFPPNLESLNYSTIRAVFSRFPPGNAQYGVHVAFDRTERGDSQADCRRFHIVHSELFRRDEDWHGKLATPAGALISYLGFGRCGEFSMLVLISAENFDVRDMKSPPINATMSSFGSVECYVHAE